MVRKFASILAGVGPVAASLVLLGVIASSVQADTLSYTVRLERTDIEVVDTGGVARVDVHQTGFDRLSEPGHAALPFRIVNVLLPQGQAVDSYRFVDGQPITIEMSAPLQLVPELVAENGTKGAGAGMASVSETGAYPESSGRYLGTGYLHGRAIASFAVFPLRESGGELVVTPVGVEVTTAVATGTDVTIRERYRPEQDARLEKVLGDFVVNPGVAAGYHFNQVQVKETRGGFQPTSYPSLEGSPVDYLIITTDALAGEYQRLADFKTAKGVPTVVRTIEWIQANSRVGVDLQETMRFFIRDAYQKWGITYLLLGGDTDILPARYAYSRYYLSGTKLPADMYFSCLDGSWNDNHDQYWGEAKLTVDLDNPDLYPEVYQGRVPISDAADVSAMIDKIISYESADNPGYLDRYLFLAEVLFPTNWVNPNPISLNGADFSEFITSTSLSGSPMTVAKMYETDWLYAGAQPENRAAVIDSLDSGFNHVNHVGHGFRFNMSVGDASVLNSDADALTNNGEWFNLYMLNCTAAAYDFFCLAEHYLQNHTGGAVSVIGSNESAFPYAASNYMNEYNDLVFMGDVVHIGEAFARSRLPRTPVAELGDNVDLYTHYIYSLLADPEMPFFTGPVKQLDVFHVTNVPLGANSILVAVSSSAVPVDSAVVCLSKDDDDYKVGATNSLGNVIINFTAESPGSISVVVTGLNAVRHQSYIVVDPSASPYVSYAGLSVDDDAIGGTVGNGDGIVDAGETIDFTVSVTNTGNASASGVTFKLRSQDPMVTVIDSSGTVGTVGVGATVAASDPVRVQFNSAIADEAAVEFMLAVTNGSLTWNDHFRKEVHAPGLEIIGLHIDDSALGNGDGIPQNGEVYDLFANIKNYGTGTASGLTATLAAVAGGVTITQGSDAYSDVPKWTAATNTTGFRLSEANASIENPLLLTISDSFGRTVGDTIELRPPTPPDSIQFDTSLGADRLQLMWKQSSSSDVRRYNVYRSLTPGGPYTQANVDPLDHAIFLDTGLAGTTVYYYVATAIDTSGNESAETAEFSASTNPAQMPGFPILMKEQTTSSPAVGDIDGDGQKEIVVGNKYVYAWHHDGIEIRDGDADPQTWGVLNTMGDVFTASVALAHMDQNPGLDIVANDLYTNSVFVMNANGDALPGWPKVALHGFRAAPAVGDLDGDGLMEVVCVDQNGVVYAWHADGTEVLDGDSNPATDGVFYVTPATVYTYMSAALCDLDGDFKEEMIIATRFGQVYALNDDGTAVPGWPFVMPGEAVGSCVTGDVDNDGFPEVVCRARTGEVYVLERDGTVATGWPIYIPLVNPFFAYSPFALGDVDDDGTLEIALTYNIGTTARLYLLKYDGTNWPGWPITTSTTNKFSECSPTLADIDGDGVLDVVLGDESRFVNAWDLSGNLLPGFPIRTGDAIRATPVFDDVDQDGDLDMVLHSWDQNIYVYDLPVAYDIAKRPWPTFLGSNLRNGRYGTFVASGIGSASFSFGFRDGLLALSWRFGNAGGAHYDLWRAPLENSDLGDFVLVARDLEASVEGVIAFEDGHAEMGRSYVYKLESTTDSGDVFTTQPVYIPISRAELDQNYPNPFNPTTQIRYMVPEGKVVPVSLVIYDVSGARVRTLVDESMAGGRREATWDGRNDVGNPVGSGVYFYRLDLPGFSSTRKMLLLK